MLFFMLSGELPFSSASILDLYHAIINEELEFPVGEWVEISESAKILIRSMLCKDPAKRATVKECLESEWIEAYGHNEAATNIIAPIMGTRAKKFASMTRMKKQVYKVMSNARGTLTTSQHLPGIMFHAFASFLQQDFAYT